MKDVIEQLRERGVTVAGLSFGANGQVIGGTPNGAQAAALAEILADYDPAAVQLEATRARARRRLAEDAELRRQLVLTAGAGKALVYREKAREAEAWLAEVDPQLADFPWIAERANRLQLSGQAVAEEWAARVAAWRSYGIAIEGAYETAAAAIDAAGDEAAIAAALAAVAWPAAPEA